jgi:hypothetical protein
VAVAYYSDHAYYDFFHVHPKIVDVNRCVVVVLMKEMDSIGRIVGRERRRIVAALGIVEVVIGMQELVVGLAMPRSVVATHIVRL